MGYKGKFVYWTPYTKSPKITDYLASRNKTSTYPHQDVERAEDVPDACVATATHRDLNCNLQNTAKLHLQEIKLHTFKIPYHNPQ
jgi:hypothetical protein